MSSAFFKRKPLGLMQEQAHITSDVPPSAGQVSHDGDDDHAEHHVGHGSEDDDDNRRHMSLVDLLAFGIGSTVGTGVFVLAGLAARDHAGPSTSLSYLLAGCVAALSGLPYAELSARFPIGGGSYEYGYIALGEGAAVLSALCQTLEYGVSSAAVARSWGEKTLDLLRDSGALKAEWLDTLLDPGGGVNPLGAAVAAAVTSVLMLGVKESKAATNLISGVKLCLIVFMIVGGFLLAAGVGDDSASEDSDERPASFSNWKPFVPPEFGVAGILRGASVIFFAFIGFDQVCNLSGESKRPTTDVPRAVVLTLVIDSLLYMLAALALTAMVPYKDISEVSGFPRAFEANGWKWAEKITAVGEIVTLPLVVLAGMQSQSRLLFAMAKDRLVPRIFGSLSYHKGSMCACNMCGCICCKGKKGSGSAAHGGGGGAEEDHHGKIGNPTANIRICGIAVILTATFVPFEYLDDLISSGVLFLFSLTDVCLLVIRYGSSDGGGGDDSLSVTSARGAPSLSRGLGRILFLMNFLSFGSGLVYNYLDGMGVDVIRYIVSGSLAFTVALLTIYLAWRYPQSAQEDGNKDNGHFRTPFVPFLPALGIFLNWFMIAHVDWKGIVLLFGYLLLGVAGYATCAMGQSVVATSASSADPNNSINQKNVEASSWITSGVVEREEDVTGNIGGGPLSYGESLTQALLPPEEDYGLDPRGSDEVWL